MGTRREDEVSRSPAGDLSSKQIRAAIYSLNEAWFHTFDEYVVARPPSRVNLSLMRDHFFGRATQTVLLLQKGHVDQVACDIAGFLSKQPRS